MKQNAQGRTRSLSRAPRGTRPLYLLALLLLIAALSSPITTLALEKPQGVNQQTGTEETSTITQETAPADVDADGVEDFLVLQRQLVVRLGLFRAGEAEGDHDDERGSRGLA